MKRESGGEDEGTPVELVYVPPLGSNYSVRREMPFAWKREREDAEIMEDHEDMGRGEQDVYRRRHHLFSVGVAGDDEADADVEGGMDVAAAGRTPSLHTSPLPVPTVVVGPDADGADNNVRGRDAYDYFGGPDLGEDFPARRRNLPGRGRRASEGDRGRPVLSSVMPDPERSRSRSKSRTPSPAVISSSDSVVESTAVSGSPESNPVPTPSAPVAVRRSASVSPPSTQTLLSPPLRGRGSSSHQDLQVHTRGRSSTRTSSSIIDREGARDKSGVGSPLGSYSPDSAAFASVGGAYAGGRVEREREKRTLGDRDRGRDRDREQPRGRDRTGKILSHSLSPDDPPAFPAPAPASAVLPPFVPPVAQDTPQVNHINPIDEVLPPSIPTPTLSSDHREAEQSLRNLTPTPSNSPVVSMQCIPAAIAASNKLPSPTKGRSPPLAVPAPHPAEPSTSYSISPPREYSVSTPPLSPRSPRSPTSPTRADGTIVGKAVDIVSSAGAFLGLWHHVGTNSAGA